MITAIAVGALVVTSCNNDDHHKEFTQDWDPSYLWAVIQTIGVPEPDGHYAPSDSVITIDNIESFDPTDSTFYFRNTEYLDSVAFPTTRDLFLQPEPTAIQGQSVGHPLKLSRARLGSHEGNDLWRSTGFVCLQTTSRPSLHGRKPHK